MTRDQIELATQLSGLMNYDAENIPHEVLEKCQRIVPQPVSVKPNEIVHAFIYLKKKYNEI